MIRIFSLGFIVLGLFLLASAGWPILQYEINSIGLSRPSLLSPVAPRVQGVSTSSDSLTPVTLTNANNWFVGDPALPAHSTKVKYYNISVLDINVRDAVVEIGGSDLSKGLIHYAGTALPGREGNTVIFGHSSLPQFFNPKNYLTIFTKLPQIEKGDRVQIDYDGIVYTYRVEEIFEVGPTDIQVLEQRYDNSFLTLVTCVPPGTYFKRLIVRARLIS